MMRWIGTVVGLALTSAVMAVGQAEAIPTFFVTSGTNPNGDLGWQAAVGTFFEDSMDSYADGGIAGISLGGVSVTFSLPGIGSGAEIFTGAYSPPGVLGTVFDAALLNRTGGTGPSNKIEFTFSQPVKGFGLWVFDNSVGSADSFTMTANSATSLVLDANPGSFDHTVEGFLGVYDPAGISSVVVTNTSGPIFFEVDHLQVAPVPEPGTLVLLASGLVGLRLVARGRRKTGA